MSTSEKLNVQNVIDRFPHSKPFEKSILAVLNLEQDENKISEIIAFYLDPSEAHGLGKLMLNALLETIDGNTSSSDQYDWAKVRREESTDQGKRIDLIIELEDRVIAIENKILHHAENNPFQEYVDHVVKYYPKKYNTQSFHILSMKKQSKKISKLENGFIHWNNLLYEEICTTVLNRISASPQNDHRVFLENSMRGLKQLNRKLKMEKAKRDFIFNNGKSIKEISNSYLQLKKACADKVKSVVHGNIKKWGTVFSLKQFEPGDHSVGYYFQIQIKKEDLHSYKIRLTNDQWSIWIWNIEEGTANSLGLEVEDKNIRYQIPKEGNPGYLKIVFTKFTYDSPEQKVQIALSQIIEKAESILNP